MTYGRDSKLESKHSGRFKIIFSMNFGFTTSLPCYTYFQNTCYRLLPTFFSRFVYKFPDFVKKIRIFWKLNLEISALQSLDLTIPPFPYSIGEINFKCYSNQKLIQRFVALVFGKHLIQEDMRNKRRSRTAIFSIESV